MPWFHGIYAIKPNFKEFQTQVGISGENTDIFIETHGPKLSQSLNTNLVITRSEHGVSVVLTDGSVHHMPTLAQDVFDVTGA
jgi:D-beta-D-heptose 7-phosphate kinase/D-beta-D-heptose 1-phosphate adenosyltransferase